MTLQGWMVRVVVPAAMLVLVLVLVAAAGQDHGWNRREGHYTLD